MKHRILCVVMLGACLAMEAPLGEQVGPQLVCPAPKSTNVKIVLRSQQNETGHWVSRVAVKQAAGPPASSQTNLWNVDVEQTAESCDEEGSLLETVFYLSAPTATRRKQRASPVAVNTETVQWSCPSCPSPPPCPSCPTPPPSPSCTTPTPCPSCPAPPPVPSCPTPPPCPSCPSPKPTPRGYIRFRDIGLYKLHTHALTWVEAKEVCEEEGGHLVVINSQDEANVLETLMNQFPTATNAPSNNVYVYVGAQRIGHVYFTVLGGRLANTGYVVWVSQEPTGGDEYCLSLARPHARFNDISCARKLAFICEHLSTFQKE